MVIGLVREMLRINLNRLCHEIYNLWGFWGPESSQSNPPSSKELPATAGMQANPQPPCQFLPMNNPD